jgi:HEAT repeat protein
VIHFDKTGRQALRWFVATMLYTAAFAFDQDAATAEDDAAKAKGTASALTWLDSLSKASLDARQNHRPILVRVRGDGCAYCVKLEAEIAKPQIQDLLKEWTLVTLDIDRSPGEAQRLNVDGIPALRALTPFGGTIASHDGFLPAAQLADWLKEQHQAAHIDRIEALLEEGEPDATAVTKLIDELQERDPLRREAALRRLRPYPQMSVSLISQALGKPSLSTRLMALDLLRDWKAPVDGLDPWRANTFTTARLKHVADWAASAKFPQADAAAERPLSSSDLASAREAIEKMLTAPAADVAAMREQLARFGRGLMPLVYGRLKDGDSDASRERLVAMRYRLVASDRLPLRWPGGLERLASMNLETRRTAVDELSHLAQAEDESLLLEIFSDPAPLVREIALRSLWTVGSKGVNQSLARLLEDPDPNVRAAVLKQLSEKPTLAVAKMVAAYAKNEKDNDLVAHAVRVLREFKTKEGVEALKPFLTHPSWQVRAEATEGIGKLLGKQGRAVNRYDRNKENAAFLTEAYGALVPLLKDPDAFVVSRALQALTEADLAVLVDPMLDVVKVHPEMTVAVIHAFDEGANWAPRVVPQLLEFCKNRDPAVRAAAIEGLGRRNAIGIDDAIEPLLGDGDQTVRIAALHAFFRSFTARHPRTNPAVAGIESDDGVTFSSSGHTVTIDVATPAPGFFDLLGRALTGGASRPAPAKKQAATRSRVPLMAERPQPAGKPDPALDPIDQPLRDIRDGRKLSNKERHLIQRIETLVHSSVPAERVAAACALAAAGRDALAVPALKQAVSSGPEHFAEISETLPWLLWNDRVDLFKRLMASGEDDHFYRLVNEVTIENDLRPLELLWKEAAAERMTGTRAYALFDGMQKCYLGNHRWQAQNAPKKALDRVTEAGTAHASSGKRFERLIGLALLVGADRDTAAELAQKIVDNEKESLNDREDALRILLRVQDRRQAQSTAVRLLASPHAEFCEEALAFLVEPADYTLTLADGQFYINTFQFRGNYEQSETKKAELPAGLKAEQVLPLLRSRQEKTAAYAGYLLCMLDHEEGLPVLLRYWEAHGARDALVSRLVYQAIAQLNFESHVPLLARIYQQFQNSDADENSHGGEGFSVKDFYWTIRTMTGPQILALRKKIREEVGIANLGQ